MNATHKRASLTSGLIATKGAAKSAMPIVDPAPAIADAVTAKPAAAANVVAEKGYHKALTFKLDRERYLKLKAAGAEKDLTSQDILLAALDAWLASNG